MKFIVVLSVVLAVAAAAPSPQVLLGSAPLLSKVQYGPAEVSVVRQPHVVTETELQYRSVPVPIKQVAYTAPEVHLETDVIHAAPAVVAAPAPAAVAYSAYPYPAPVAAALL